uniref:23S rRNA (adenine(1618)-N(6))-methyltransferase RlmF n=1 Tax=Thaumasiovibrio occultus TaxID=1891184 RepID=UPI000B3546BE|nr:23S rRNA (adenine(1618)-N(6))-methyltransferase RlmF [Thaumasiovibrio occultus]
MHAQKPGFHPRNKHKNGYNFPLLVKANPALKPFVILSPAGRQTIDFAKPDAVVALNRALLCADYRIQHWNLPSGQLCPPIPGRVDYLHYLADLLAESANGDIPQGKRFTGLDIGVGANCIYPLLGHATYGWRFVGSDVQQSSVAAATTLCSSNPPLQKVISIRHQVDQKHIFQGIITTQDRFTFTMCNPPFHRSAEEASAGSERKRRNLRQNQVKRGQQQTSTKQLNFGGNAAELWCEGGERRFISTMIDESICFKDQVLWFTTLVAKSENLPALKAKLTTLKVSQLKVIEMHQGNKITRVLAWSFHDKQTAKRWFVADKAQ